MSILRTHAQNNSRTFPAREERQLTGRLGPRPSRAASHWLLSFHPQSLLAVRCACGEHVPTAASGIGSANGRVRRRGKRSAACARGPEGKQNPCACGALAAVRARGGVSLWTEESTFLQPGKAACPLLASAPRGPFLHVQVTMRPGLRVSLSAKEPPGQLTVQPFPSRVWLSEQKVTRGAVVSGGARSPLSGPQRLPRSWLPFF